MAEILLNGHSMNNLQYGDDAVLVVEKETVSRNHECNCQTQNKGFGLSSRKTEVMVDPKKQCITQCKQVCC